MPRIAVIRIATENTTELEMQKNLIRNTTENLRKMLKTRMKELPACSFSN